MPCPPNSFGFANRDWLSCHHLEALDGFNSVLLLEEFVPLREPHGTLCKRAIALVLERSFLTLVNVMDFI